MSPSQKDNVKQNKPFMRLACVITGSDVSNNMQYHIQSSVGDSLVKSI